MLMFLNLIEKKNKSNLKSCCSVSKGDIKPEVYDIWRLQYRLVLAADSADVPALRLFEAPALWCTVTAGSCGVTAATLGHRWPLHALRRPEESGGLSQVQRPARGHKAGVWARWRQWCHQVQQDEWRRLTTFSKLKSRSLCPERLERNRRTGEILVKYYLSLNEQNKIMHSANSDGCERSQFRSVSIKMCFSSNYFRPKI